MTIQPCSVSACCPRATEPKADAWATPIPRSPLGRLRCAGASDSIVVVIVQVRTATAADEAFLWDMLYLALYVPARDPPLPRSVLTEPALARYVENWGARPGDRGLIAVKDRVPVGAAWLRLFPSSDPGYGFVDETIPELSVAVQPECRGHGIGSRLLEGLLREVPAVSLSCDPANPAWRLYLRLGFRVLPDGRTMLRRS